MKNYDLKTLILTLVMFSGMVRGQSNVFPTPSGNVGVGTSSPNEMLEVGGSGRVFIGDGAGGSRKGLLIDAVEDGTYVRLHPYNYGNGAGLNLAILPYGSGNVGIGIASPQAKLDVVGTTRLRGNAQIDAGYNLFFGLEEWFGGSDTGGADYGYIYYTNDDNSYAYWGDSGENGALIIGTQNDGPNSVSDVLVLKGAAANIFDSPNHLFVSGNVGVGTTSPSHKLTVNGTIRAKEVIVDTGWADYVFADDYRLAPLSEVEAHIKEHKHLPGIPSAAQVAEQGVSMGEMQARMMAKLEEMMLHMIRLEKENAELRKRLQSVEAAIK